METSGVEVRDLLEARGPLMLVVDAEGRIRAWNRALTELTGYAAGEVLGALPWERLLTPEDGPAFQQAFAEVVAGTRLTLEGRWVMRAGASRWLVWSALVRRGKDGVAEDVVLLGLDRTEPARAREALRDSEAKFAGIISIAADAIVSVDGAQRIVLFNRGAEKMFGWSAAEILGQHLDVLIPERFREQHRGDVDTFARGPIVARQMGERQADVWGLRKNGEEFPAEAAISKLVVSGELLLTAAMRDVTERRAIEREQRFLAEVGARLGESLDGQQTLETISTLAVRFLANFCVADLLGEAGQLRRVAVAHARPEHAPLAKQLQGILLQLPGPSLPSRAIRERQARRVALEPGTLEALAEGPEHLAALQALSPRSLMAVPLIAHGRVLGALLFVSTTRTYDADALRLAQELGTRAATAMENARLFEEAQRALRARDEILRVVAHDLRNPLNAIGLAASALRGAELPSELVHKRAEGILRASARMGRLIEDLLDISRIEAGTLRLEQEAVLPAEVLQAALEAERPLALEAGLTLEPDAPTGLPAVWADRDRVGQVFENLIGNAIKFTPRGGRIVVGARLEPGAIHFWVMDTGPGLAPEQRARLFEPFWQARPQDRRGAGLGLAICRGIVEGHGGRIWADSEPGHGSTFSFRLPLA